MLPMLTTSEGLRRMQLLHQVFYIWLIELNAEEFDAFLLRRIWGEWQRARWVIRLGRAARQRRADEFLRRRSRRRIANLFGWWRSRTRSSSSAKAPRTNSQPRIATH